MIYDNLLPENDLVKILDLIESVNFPYYWQEDIDYGNKTTNDISNYGLAHLFFDEGNRLYSPFLDQIEPVVLAMCERIGKPLKQLLRIRAVLLTNVGCEHQNIKHVDLDDYPDSLTGIFYPNVSDGDLYVYDGDVVTAVEPIRNRCVILGGSVPHHGSNPVKHKRRVAVNVNFVV